MPSRMESLFAVFTTGRSIPGGQPLTMSMKSSFESDRTKKRTTIFGNSMETKYYFRMTPSIVHCPSSLKLIVN